MTSMFFSSIFFNSTGERGLHQFSQPLLHRHGSRSEGDLHVEPHVVVVRAQLPRRYGTGGYGDARPQARRYGSGALRDDQRG